MDQIKKGFAMLCAVLFVLTAMPALLFFNLDRYAFSAETYQLALANEQFYNRFPAKLAESLASYTSNTGNLPVVIQGLSAPDWEAFLRALLPPEELKLVSDQALRSIFDYLNGNTDTAQVSLAPLKGPAQPPFLVTGRNNSYMAWTAR